MRRTSRLLYCAVRSHPLAAKRCGQFKYLNQRCLASSSSSSSSSTNSVPNNDTLKSAFEHLKGNRPEEAMRDFRAVLQADPDNVQALVSLALFVQNSEPEEAAALFEKAMKLGGADHPELAGCYATFLHNVTEDLPRAEEYYRRATAHKDCQEPIVFQFGVLLDQLGRPDEARQWLEKALEMDPDKPRTHCAYGNLLFRHYHSPDVAERCFKKALELDEFDYDANLNYAQFLQVCRKDFSQAEEYFTKCLALDVHDGTPVLAQFLVSTMGRHKGQERFQELVADATDFPILAYCSFAQWAVDEKQDFRTAETFYKKCLEIPLNQSNIDAALYAQIILRYAFFCVHHMRQVQTAQQLVQYASKIVPDLAPDIVTQFQDILQMGNEMSGGSGPNGSQGPKK